MKVPLIITFTVVASLNIYNFFTQRTAIRIKRYCGLTEEEQSILYPAYYNYNLIVSLVYVVLLFCLAIWIDWISAIAIGIGLLLFCMVYPLPIHYFIQVFRKKLQKDLGKGKMYGRLDLLDGINEFERKLRLSSSKISIESKQSIDEYFNEGNDKYALHDYKAAIENYKKAIEINPHDSVPYYNRGNAKYQLQDYIGAAKDFSTAIRIDPRYASAYNNRANVKYQLMDYLGVIADSSIALEINPKHTEALHIKGLSKSILQDYSGAVADLTALLEIDPKHAWAYYHRGIAKIHLGQNDSGCSDFRKAHDLGLADAFEMIKKYCNQ
jgi:tetratricopeptide (TPR) repeat protein